MNNRLYVLGTVCCVALALGSLPAAGKTVVVDGVAVKTISAALAALDRNDGDSDVIDVKIPVVVEPGQVTISGKDPITINLDAGGKPGTIVFPKSITKAGFSIEPPVLETAVSYTIQNGIIVPQFENKLEANAKSAFCFKPADGSIGFSANLKNLTVTASAEGDAPVPVQGAYAKSNTHWYSAVTLDSAWNNLENVSLNISNCTFFNLTFGLALWNTANLGGLKINLTDTKIIRMTPGDSRPISVWAGGGIILNMTRTEFADFYRTQFEYLRSDRGIEWNINEGCSIHDCTCPIFTIATGNSSPTVTINLNGTAANPVRLYNIKGYCFDVGYGQKWANERAGFSINAAHAKFSNNGGVLKTNWLPTNGGAQKTPWIAASKPAPINFKFTSCEFTDNGKQPLLFEHGRFTASFRHCTFSPSLGPDSINGQMAATESGTGELTVTDSVITAAASAPGEPPKENGHVAPRETSFCKATDIVSRSADDNQVFQFMTTQSYSPDTNKFRPHTSIAYLWIPPTCTKVKGVLVFGYNVPEHWLVGHPAIRKVCAEQDLAILFTCQSCRLFGVCADGQYPAEAKAKAHATFLQQIMDALARESGYAELSTAPWLPIGESMSLMLVTYLVNGAPQRCIAGIHLKDGQWGAIQATDVPMLEACGTAVQWGHPNYDIATLWKEMATTDLGCHIEKRTAVPTWPGSLLVEAGSAHFSCTELMCRFLAQYISAACKARIPADGSSTLRPVDLNSGYVACLPVPAATPMKPKPYSECTPEERTLPWYFDRELAQAAYDMANINWEAQSPEPAFADREGRPIPFNAAGTTDLPCVTEDDGISFSLNAIFLDKLPAASFKGRTPVGHPPGKPSIEWVCGSVIPLGENRFQIAEDRCWNCGGNRLCFQVIHPGDANYRLSINPGGMQLAFNNKGKQQKIAFDEIPDQKIGVKEVQLHATADSGMPVRFFVKVGPAEIKDDRLVLTPLPPRSKMPVTVTVVAWQYGCASEPAVQTAANVERTFRIIP